MTAGHWLAVLTGFCWAILAIGLKLSLEFTDANTVVWFRMLFSFLFVGAWLTWTKPRDLVILRKPPLLGILGGLCLAFNYVGFMKGVELTSPSNAQVFIQLAPACLIFVGIFYFKEIPSKLQIFGFILAAFGFVLFYEGQLQLAVQNQVRYIQGNVWILLAAATWVVFASFQKVLYKLWTPLQQNLLVYGLSTLVLAPFADFSVFATLTTSQWLLLFALGLNTVIAYGAFGLALHKAPAKDVSLIITLNPLLTLAIMKVLEWQKVTWIVPDRIQPLGYAAAAIVVTGVILAVRK